MNPEKYNPFGGLFPRTPKEQADAYAKYAELMQRFLDEETKRTCRPMIKAKLPPRYVQRISADDSLVPRRHADEPLVTPDVAAYLEDWFQQ